MKNANLVSLGLMAAVFLGSGCGQERAAGAGASPKTVFDHFSVNIGGHPTSLQFAVLDREQERGLMQRPDLGRDEGMIFVEAVPRRENFWMKNTPEALDIAFAGPDGVIAEIYPLYPFDERGVPSHSDQMQLAVEMRQGWFAENGVRAGAAIDMKAVADALKERGFDPARFRLR